ncbi:T-complex protein 1 subunit theta, putative [Plasmodium ovale]|uniref:T-complex protein 1 subunit theta, putative n=2 Tax=Plasmodium ovale TaxID=36330 RepID=A0A1A8VJY9_PLAOA|nr:T-complex protein 1 subunit theta, putative [Plasmodium ovale curtisi]SBS81423.1 T-complex protein 1 subunit theta, putative [Plasmodium ovale curtisi]SCN43082.1 T-complex protein 1 subunit theta, putative [Plasmodium ovale]
MFANKLGVNSLLKDGYRIVKNNEDAILKNIEACKEICGIIQTSMGPKCMNKLIVNHINKKVVSSDCITILKDLEINHPVVNILKRLSETMNYEYGDFTNYVFTITTEMLDKASFLLHEGFHVNDILHGFMLGYKEIERILPDMIVWKLNNFYDEKEIEKVIKSVMITKNLSYNYDYVINLVAKCITTLMPEKIESFDVDNIRISKLNGGNLIDSQFLMGMVIPKETNGIVKKKENANVIVLNCGLEAATTETKGTVLLHNAEELLNFTKGEEEHMKKIIEGIKKEGVDVIIVNGAISDIAQHFCDANEIMTLRLTSKFETLRICKLLSISSMVKLTLPQPEDIGKASSIYVSEIASKKVTIINSKSKKVGTIILRGATYNLLDEVERCIHDGINSIKNAIKCNSFLYGGGCTEIQICERLKHYAQELNGINNYSVKIFAEAFQVVPKILSSNCGYNSTDVINELTNEHNKGNIESCVNIGKDGHITSAKHNNIYDNYKCKKYAIDLAIDAVQTILKIDQIILAKPAGGPRPRDKNPDFDEAF